MKPALAGVALGVTLVSCAGAGTTVDVFAGSSLTNVLIEAEQIFEATHDGVDIRLNLGGSNTLARQINDGNEAELFIAADRAQLAAIEPRRLGSPAVSLASNRLVLIVPAGSRIPSLGETPTPTEVLAWAGSFSRCATGVPCGDATDRWITGTSDLPSPGSISIENNVRAVLAKVRAGEVDVGAVYVTDAEIARDDVAVIDLGPDAPTTEVAAVAIGPDDGEGASMARVFLDFLASDGGRSLFSAAGFGAP